MAHDKCGDPHCVGHEAACLRGWDVYVAESTTGWEFSGSWWQRGLHSSFHLVLPKTPFGAAFLEPEPGVSVALGTYEYEQTESAG